MADFIPIHVTKDGSDTDGLREFSSSDDIQVTNNLKFKDTNIPYIYFSNETGNDGAWMRSRREWNSAWQNVLEIGNYETGTTNNRTVLKITGNGELELGYGPTTMKNTLQLHRSGGDITSFPAGTVEDFRGGVIYFKAGSDNKIQYWDGSATQVVASEAYVAANAGGGGGVTPEFFMFLG